MHVYTGKVASVQCGGMFELPNKCNIIAYIRSY